jgi:hypothetical protein
MAGADGEGPVKEETHYWRRRWSREEGPPRRPPSPRSACRRRRRVPRPTRDFAALHAPAPDPGRRGGRGVGEEREVLLFEATREEREESSAGVLQSHRVGSTLDPSWATTDGEDGFATQQRGRGCGRDAHAPGEERSGDSVRSRLVWPVAAESREGGREGERAHGTGRGGAGGSHGRLVRDRHPEDARQGMFHCILQ